MKKNIILALTAAMLLSATGCNGGESSDKSGNVSASAPTTSASTTTASSAEESTSAPEADKPEESKEFAGLAGFESAADHTNLVAGGSFCEAEEGFYYADDTGIYHVTDDTTEQVYEGKATDLSMHNGRLYFLQEFGNICVYSGGTVTTAVTCDAIELAASSTGTYYIDNDHDLHKIYGADTVIIDAEVNSLNIAGDYVVFTETATDRLCAYNSADDSIIMITEKGRKPVVSGDKVYYINENGGIDCMSLTDGSKTTVAEVCSGNIAVRNGTVYYIDGAKICSVTDGEPTELYTASDESAELSALSLCGETLYFTENGKVMQLTDGTASEFTVTITE